jgi:hypothetical protein
MYTIASSETKFEEKFKQGCSPMQQISAKRTTTSHPKSLKTKKTTRYEKYGNPGLRQAQNCGGAKHV